MSLSGVHQAQLFQNLMLDVYPLSDVKSKSFINESIRFSRDSLKEKGKKILVAKAGKTGISMNFH